MVQDTYLLKTESISLGNLNKKPKTDKDNSNVKKNGQHYPQVFNDRPKNTVLQKYSAAAKTNETW